MSPRLNCAGIGASGPNHAAFVGCQMCNFETRNASNRVARKDPGDGRSELNLSPDEDPRIPLLQGQVLLRWANRGKFYGI
jgi:hypothetical protein